MTNTEYILLGCLCYLEESIHLLNLGGHWYHLFHPQHTLDYICHPDPTYEDNITSSNNDYNLTV